MSGVGDEHKKALLDALLEADGVAKRLTTDAANDCSPTDIPLDSAIRSCPNWWFPKYEDRAPSRAGWRAFAERRRRFAKGMRDLAAMTLLIAVTLPGAVDRWLFCGFGLVLALVWAWQLDVANREMTKLGALSGCPVHPKAPPSSGAIDV